VSYIAKELIVGYGHNKKITRLVDQFEFTIVPVLNTDGYAYTWEHNRMWRKNRQPTSIPFCPGIVCPSNALLTFVFFYTCAWTLA
jgi:extracellular matrix protein 14